MVFQSAIDRAGSSYDSTLSSWREAEYVDKEALVGGQDAAGSGGLRGQLIGGSLLNNYEDTLFASTLNGTNTRSGQAFENQHFPLKTWAYFQGP